METRENTVDGFESFKNFGFQDLECILQVFSVQFEKK